MPKKRVVSRTLFGQWRFAYCLNADLPRTRSARYAEGDGAFLLASTVTLREDLAGSPFSWDLRATLDRHAHG